MKIKSISMGLLLLSSVLLSHDVDQFAFGLKSIVKTTFREMFKEAVMLFGKPKEKNKLETQLKEFGLTNNELIKNLLNVSKSDEKTVYEDIAKNEFALDFIDKSSPEERAVLLNNTTFLKFLLINKDLKKDSSWYKDVFKRMKNVSNGNKKFESGIESINELIDAEKQGNILKVFSITNITKYFPFTDDEEKEEISEEVLDDW